MHVVLINPPTLHRGRSVESLNSQPGQQPQRAYYRSILAADLGKSRGFSTLTGEHLGLQSLQANLLARGHTVELVNACAELHTDLRQTLGRLREHIQSAGIIGFTGSLDVLGENVWLARAVRALGYTGHITIGHDLATLNHEALLRTYIEFDSAVRGEGEETICELADALAEHRALASIRGLTFRDGGDLTVNVDRPPVNNLDALPAVTRPHLRRVLDIGMSAAIYTTRGCPYRCAFCTTGEVSARSGLSDVGRWRQRSAARVVDEIERLVEEFNVSHVTIVDDLFIGKGGRAEHALEFAAEIMERHLAIEYMFDCRVDGIERDTFAVLKRSGLRKVFVGIESGSARSLQVLGKGYKPSLVRQKLHILEQLDIDVIWGYIFFNPMDDIDGLGECLRLVLDGGCHDLGLLFQTVRVYPGTLFERILRSSNLLEGDFPYLRARFADTAVERIYCRVQDLAQVADEVVKGSDQVSDGMCAQGEMVFRIVIDGLRNMLLAGRNGELAGIDSAYSEMIHVLRKAYAGGQTLDSAHLRSRSGAG